MLQAPNLWALLVFVGTAILTAGLTWCLVRFRILAVPNERSAHQIAVPTAGGLALVIAIIGGLLSLALFAQVSDRSLLSLLGFASIAAILGFVDDIAEILTKVKFAIIGLLAVALALVLGPVTVLSFDESAFNLPVLIGIVGSALWAFTLINSVNFMDGADGVIPLSALFVALGLSILGALFGVWSVCWSGLLLAAVLVGFLPFNLPRAQIFLGDAGALFIGVWLAGTALIFIREGPPAAIWLMPLLMMPWLSDVLLTLAWRGLNKQNLLSAHRDHLYQRSLVARADHLPIAVGLSLQVLVVLGLAVIFRGSATSAFLAFVASASFAALVHWQFRRQFQR